MIAENRNPQTIVLYMIKEFVKRNKSELLIFGISLLVKSCYYVFLPGIVSTTGADEIGTIAGGAFFAGFDWSPVVSRTLYYGFGYSAWTAPLFLLGLNPGALHICLLFYNAICLSFCGVLCYRILTRMFELENPVVCVFISLASIFSPINMADSNIAYNESMLFLINWVVLYLLLDMTKSGGESGGNVKKSLLLSAILCYGFIVHTRIIFTLGAVCVYLVCQYIMTRKRILNWRAFVPAFAVFLFAARMAVDLVQVALWKKGDVPLTNSVESLGGLYENILFLFSASGLKEWLRTIIGQAHSMLIFSGGILMVLFACVAVVVCLLTLPKTRRETWDMLRENRLLFLGVVFTVSILVASVALTALSNIENIRIKVYLYQRYWAVVAGPALAVALTVLYRFKQSKELWYSTIAVSALLCIGFVFKVAPMYQDVPANSSGVYTTYLGLCLLKPGDLLNGSDLVIITTVAVVISFFVFFLWKREKYARSLSVLICFFLYCATYAAVFVQIPNANASRSQFADTRAFFEKLAISSKDYPRVYSNIEGFSLLNLQYTFYEHTIDPEELCDLAVVIQPVLLPTHLRVENAGEKNSVLIRKENEQLVQTAEDAGYTLVAEDSCKYEPEHLLYNPEPGVCAPYLAGQILEPGQMQFGPYALVVAGRYRITIEGVNLANCEVFSHYWVDGEMINAPVQNLVRSNNRIIYEIEIHKHGRAEFYTIPQDSVIEVKGIVLTYLSPQ